MLVRAGTLSDTDINVMRSEISDMYQKFERGDISTLLDKTHQSLFEYVGGRANFEALTKGAIDQLMSVGVKFTSSELGTPDKLYDAGDCDLCFVPRTSVMEIQGKTVRSIGFMIAIRDKGQSGWKYLDGSGLRKNPDFLRELIPELEDGVVLPENTVQID